MAHANGVEWRKLPISLTELCINTTLRCGQSFRWRQSAPDEWSCALHGRIYTLKQDPKHLHYRAISPPSKAHRKDPLTPPPSSPVSSASGNQKDFAQEDTTKLLHHYLNLGPNLSSLYAQWAASDSNFRRKAPNFTGIRILKQDPWETLCGFICSSNNNIKRISQMMHKLCIHYGSLIGHLDHIEPNPQSDDEQNKSTSKQALEAKVPYYDFPSPEALTGPGVEAHLRELGFGYRAKYIYQTACIIADEKGGKKWLETLMNSEQFPSWDSRYVPQSEGAEMPEGGREGYRQAHEALLELQGVGPKVADCICLMGLGWSEAVPIDTHVWQIAQRDYKLGKGKHSSLTKASYDAVGNKFRSLWGKEAGWAHSVLFTADLRAFSERVVGVKVETEVDMPVQTSSEGGDDLEEKENIVIKTEDKGPVKASKNIKKGVVVEKMVKRPYELDEQKVLEVHADEDMISRVKRRRTTFR